MLNKEFIRQCFDGLILPYDCDDVAGDALFITEYDGISVSKLASTVDTKFVSLKKAVAEKSLIAVRNVWNKTKYYLSNNKGISFEACERGYISGSFSSNAVDNSAGDGLIIAKPAASKYSAIKVGVVTIKSPLNGTYSVFIKDIGGNILWQQNVNLTPNIEVNIAVDTLFYSNIIISTNAPQGYQASINSVTENCDTVVIKDVCTDTCCDLLYRYLVGGIQKTIGSTLTACFAVVCSEDLMLCDLKNELQYAILNQTVHHLLAEAANTDRVNAFVLNGMDWMEDNKTLSLQMADNEIQNVGDQIVAKLVRDKCCIRCNGTGGFRKITVLP